MRKFNVGDVVKGVNSFNLEYIVKTIIDEYTLEVVYFNNKDAKYMYGGRLFWDFYLYEVDVVNMTKVKGE